MPHEIYGTVAEWLDFAKMDLDAAIHIDNTMIPKPIEIICYHCQQCAEKSLKAFLLFSGISFSKTHDTSLLCAECKKLNPKFGEVLSESATLKNYSVTSRYPYPIQIEESDVKKALADAQKIFNLAKSLTVPSDSEQAQ